MNFMTYRKVKVIKNCVWLFKSVQLGQTADIVLTHPV